MATVKNTNFRFNTGVKVSVAKGYLIFVSNVHFFLKYSILDKVLDL